ncbi:MAG: MarR family transcriptional regulator [Candidatus Omnitrophica bacterium]|nr:MarR family transcriptional regulator [Candidatus Omnitrophota bacterium]MCB9721410.1 MarR family transcriptional regulator [Candidatus Omnitrophota bacterium]
MVKLQSMNEIAEELPEIMPVIARKVLLDFFQAAEISQSQLLMLMAVKAKQPCRLSELSREMEVSNPTASGLVDRLVQHGLVERSANPNDRRAVSISLSERGEKLVAKFRHHSKERWQEILTNMTSQDQNDFIRILRDIRKQVA